MGREVLYTADTAMGLVRFIEPGAEARHREQDRVSLTYSADDVLLFDKGSGRRLEARIAA
jgi:hypothetical protein